MTSHIPAAGCLPAGLLPPPESIELDEPDLERAQEERFSRNRTAMQAVDRHITAGILPKHGLSLEEQAAVAIQAAYRGHLGRRRYYNTLLAHFQQEEAMRLEKTLTQVAEGELLVENRRLEVQIEDNATARRNKSRHLTAHVITLQRAWRAFQQRRSCLQQTTLNMSPSSSLELDCPESEPSSESDATQGTGAQPMSVSTPDSSERLLKSEEDEEEEEDVSDFDNDDSGSSSGGSQPCACALHNKHVFIEPEPESCVSDCSEMAEPIKQHLADLQHLETVAKQPAAAPRPEREPAETLEEYERRLKRINVLSLAQEFAALKKIDADALPFDLHLTSQSPVSEMSSSEAVSSSSSAESAAATPLGGARDFPEELAPAPPPPPARPNSVRRDSDANDNVLEDKAASEGDFDVYNIETTLPQMDWALLEQQLKKAAEEEEQQKKCRRTEREEIRRRLAMVGVDEEYYGGERAYKKPNLQTRLQSGMNLQICFLNDPQPSPPQPPPAGQQPLKPQVTPQADPKAQNANLVTPAPGEEPARPRPEPRKVDEEDEDFFAKQQRLQAEATLALAQVRPMAHMQLEIEKQNRKKSPIAEIIQTGIPGFSDGKKKKLAPKVLLDMNLAQLQVVVNDLHTQIETLNEELVTMLVERDDLHMQQDSMLVNSEDLLARAQEYSAKVQPKKKKEKKK